MKPNLRIKTNYIGWLVILLAISMLYLGYFFIYIPQQEALVKERGFRILKEYGKNMHDKYDYYQKHIDNYGVFYSIRSILDTIPIEEVHQIKKSSEENNKIFRVIDNLDKTILTEINDSLIPYTYNSQNNQFFLNFGSPNGLPDSVLLKLSDVFDKKILNQLKLQFIYKVPISTLMQGLKFDKLLDNIVLFNDSTVFYNSNKDIVQDITNPGALSDSSSHHQGGVFETIEVRGEKKHVMIVPISYLGKDFYLAGFIPGSEFKKKTRTINSQLLIIISGILLLVLIGMPVLKIIFISPNEALRINDASGATMSMILSVSLLILITISTLKHYIADRKVLQNRIIRISDKIYQNVDDDLNSVINLYLSIVNPLNVDTTKLAGYARYNFVTDTNFQQIPPSLLDGQVPINEIILINSNGIVSQAVTRTPFSDVVEIDLSERLYFKNVTDNSKNWVLKNRIIKEPSKAPLNKRSEKFYIESIKSYNTGYHETAISFRLRETNAIGSLSPVLAITSHIPSLYDQILPKDIEFVVINEEGDVLFHSVKSKNLHENFLDEVNSNQRLIGALHHRIDKTMEITYNEKQWMARVIPLKDMPLYHITLLDLQQTQNKNARIFLFTFYFLLITFLCILVGIQIMQRINNGNTFSTAKSGTLNWLFFQQAKYPAYKALLQIQSIIIICQLAGIYLNDNPIVMLLYQLIFIGFSGLAALAILGGRKDPFLNFFQKSHLSSSLIIIIDVLLIILLWKLKPGVIIYFSIIALVILFGFIHYLSKKELLNQSSSDADNNSTTTYVKKVFLSYMFLWLVSFSVVPVIQYYFSTKNQEEKLWQRDQMEQVAHKNLLLKKELENEYGSIKTGDWYPKIQGNGIDFLEITEGPCTNDILIPKKENSGETSLSLANRLYSRLPDPVTKGDHLMSLLRDESFQDEWSIKGSVLCYSRTESEGKVQVVSSGRIQIKPIKWLLYFFIPILLILLFIWSLNSYMVKHLFNTLLSNWITPEIPPWEEVINNKKINKVLLVSLGGKKYYKKTIPEPKLIPAEQSLSPDPDIEKATPKPKLIPAEQLFGPDFDIKTFVSEKNEIIWIRGLGDYFEQIDKAELIIDNLMKINQDTNGKLIIELPYDLDFLDEYYKDYMSENELEKKDHLRIISLKRNLGNLFKDYYRYPGNLIPDPLDSNSDDKKDLAEDKLHDELTGSENIKQQSSQKQLLAIKDGNALHYSYIWNKLTKMEKMTLYDLADDGMLNFKNKVLINQLQMKGLIHLKPYPELFAESFQYFLLFSIDPEEKHSIEQKLNRQGKWKNRKYLILLILVLLAGFVFIAQGSSIEKVIGILTGSLAVFSGVTRLIDSNAFRQT